MIVAAEEFRLVKAIVCGAHVMFPTAGAGFRSIDNGSTQRSGSSGRRVAVNNRPRTTRKGL